MKALVIAGLLMAAPAATAGVEDQYRCTLNRNLPVGWLWVGQPMSLQGVRGLRQSIWTSGVSGHFSLWAAWNGDFTTGNDRGEVEIVYSLFEVIPPDHRYRIEIRRDDGLSNAMTLAGPLQSPVNRMQFRVKTNVAALRAMILGVDRLQVVLVRDDGQVAKTAWYQSAVIEGDLKQMAALQQEFETVLADPAKRCEIEDPDNPLIIVD